MAGTIGRRGACTAMAAAAVAGCIGTLGRERKRRDAVRSSPGDDRTWDIALGSGDRIILEYRSSGDDPSRLVVEGPNGEVVYDESISEDGSLRYRATDSGTHTVRFEWGSRARIDLYIES